MTGKLDLYLTLERAMLDLDEAGDLAADDVRDMMDPLWYGLSDEDRAMLDAREIEEVRLLNPIRLAAGGEVIFTPSPDDAPYTRVEPRDGVGRRFETGWLKAA